MKKILLIILMLICFLAVGCERGGTLTSAANNKKSSILSPAQKNNATSASVNKADDSVNTTSKEMQETSNMLDKLDSTLNGLDNSSEINTTESIINNIN